MPFKKYILLERSCYLFTFNKVHIKSQHYVITYHNCLLLSDKWGEGLLLFVFNSKNMILTHHLDKKTPKTTTQLRMKHRPIWISKLRNTKNGRCHLISFPSHPHQSTNLVLLFSVCHLIDPRFKMVNRQASHDLFP